MLPVDAPDASRILALAKQEATRCRAAAIAPEHVLLGIVQDGRSPAAEILRDLGVHLERVRQEIEWKLVPSTGGGAPAPSPETAQLRERASQIAQKFGRTEIGSEHLLLAIVQSAGIPQQVLAGLGVREAEVMSALDAGDR